MALRAQDSDVGSMRSDTFRSLLSKVGGPMGEIGEMRDIHGSFHTLILLPDPTIQPRPFTKTSRPIKIPLQPRGSEEGWSVSKKLEEWQYIPKRTRESRDWGNLSTRQAAFARRASLNCSISRKPSPPTDLGRVRVFQETQAIFLIAGFKSHQNIVSIDWICLHKDSGSLKHVMVWAGRAVRTALSKTSLPAPFKNLVVLLWDHWRILSTRPAKMSRLRRVKCSGTPRYFPTPPSLSMSRKSFTLFLVAVGVLEEKVMVDLSLLIHCPEAFIAVSLLWTADENGVSLTQKWS